MILNPFVYFFAEYFPWWGIPTALIFAEVSNYFRRRSQKLQAIIFALASLSMVALVILYFTEDGFRNLRPAMQNLEKKYGN